MSKINNIKKMKKKSEDDNEFRFRLSPLHCRIKLMECIHTHSIHHKYKNWKVSLKSVEREKMEEQKNKIQ